MSEDNSAIWSMVTELSSGERHFNDIQHNYRMLCSTWILAAFAGFGFILTTKDVDVFLPRELVVAFLSVASAVGTTLLWTLDLRVYHQLLDCYFVAGLKFERENPWLPQVRTAMLKTQGAHGVLSRVVWFYIGSVTSVLLTGGVLFSLYFYRYALWQAILAGLVWLVLMGAWGYVLYSRTTSEPLTNQNSDLR